VAERAPGAGRGENGEGVRTFLDAYARIEPFSEGTHSFPADVAQNEYFPRTIVLTLSTAAYSSSPYISSNQFYPRSSWPSPVSRACKRSSVYFHNVTLG
jgi:hypothetical protein